MILAPLRSGKRIIKILNPYEDIERRGVAMQYVFTCPAQGCDFSVKVENGKS
ncbi:MAG: hypothetical protein AB1390_03245 [Nitrospirota bacterium]